MSPEPKSTRGTGSRALKQTRISHLPLTKFKGRETGRGNTKEEFISARPMLGRQQTHMSGIVSKVLKTLLGLYQKKKKKNVELRSVGTCSWAADIRSIIVLGSITWGLAGVRALPIA